MGCNGMASSSSSSSFPANFFLQMQQTHHEVVDHRLLPTSHTPAILSSTGSCADLQHYHGFTAMMGPKRPTSTFSGMEVCEEEVNGEEDFSDDCSQVGEKKRRLNLEQVKTLEKNFELGNRLEPERKMQLAMALGMQPRQIAIWFQNRRARWKTKQLEKDYDVLKKEFDSVKSENDSLKAHNKKLQEEIMALKGMEIPGTINLNKETEGSCSYRSDNSTVINLDISAAPATDRDSPLNSNPNRNFFHPIRPPPPPPPAGAAPLFLQGSSTRPDLQCPKVEHGGAPQEESFCNMFCGVEDQHSFWAAWQEQHSFH